jgi:hypothetical protein
MAETVDRLRHSKIMSLGFDEKRSIMTRQNDAGTPLPTPLPQLSHGQYAVSCWKWYFIDGILRILVAVV